MPLENSRTQGTNGNNSDYQRGVIELLKQVVAASGGTGPGSLTPNILRPTGTGTIIGAKTASIYNSGAANGTVLGVVFKPGEILTWESGSTIGNISYDATGTEFLINTLT